jgi:hypothetical protein
MDVGEDSSVHIWQWISLGLLLGDGARQGALTGGEWPGAGVAHS